MKIKLKEKKPIKAPLLRDISTGSVVRHISSENLFIVSGVTNTGGGKLYRGMVRLHDGNYDEFAEDMCNFEIVDGEFVEL